MTTDQDDNSRLVYSTAHGKMCPSCNRPVSQCNCRKQKKAAPKTDGIVRVGRETKGRKGKGVTVITGVPLDNEEIKDLGRELKKKCGTGGTVRDGVIEIQGDHRELLVSELQKKGWTVRRSGG